MLEFIQEHLSFDSNELEGVLIYVMVGSLSYLLLALGVNYITGGVLG